MRRIAWVALLSFAGTAVADDDGKALFRTLRVGMKIRYRSSSRTVTETKGDWRKSGGERTKGKEKALEVWEREWVETVLGVKSGEGHLLERKYETSTKGAAKGATMPAKPEAMERTSIHGKTLHVRRAGPSVWLAVKQGTLQGEEESELKFLEQMYELMPEGVVKPGETWEPDGTRVARTLFDGIYDETNFKAKAKCAYKANEKVGGRSCARIAVQLSFDVARFGEVPEIHAEYAGVLLVALDSGVLLGYDLSGPVRLSGRTKEPNGAEIDYLAAGTRTMTLRGEVLEDGGELEGGTLEVPQ